MAFLVGGAALLINFLESNFLTPWLSVRASQLNLRGGVRGRARLGLVVGPGGLFLGLPILIAIKAVRDRVDGLQAVGELLGD